MKKNLIVFLAFSAIASLAVFAFTIAPQLTGHGGMGGYTADAPATFELAPPAEAAAGPANFPYGIYNGCSGGLVASAGIATGTAPAPCNPAQLHGCIAQAGTNITPVAGDASNCQITTFGIVTVVGTASATVTVTGVKIIMATAGAAGATQKWIGY